MPAGQPLGEFEQLVMLGVLQSGADAYGVPVWREIEARAARSVSIGAVYKTLDRLESKGFVRSHTGQPTAERGAHGKLLASADQTGDKKIHDVRASQQEQ
ncbi:MAG: helix-turn-helix transcriptional regulator [Acidobacteria bacterium]|nr:helix-turn-helix transcriptional regulator [Acidobacteriota bacterium]